MNNPVLQIDPLSYFNRGTVTGRVSSMQSRRPVPKPDLHEEWRAGEEARELCHKQLLFGWKGMHPFKAPKGKKQFTPIKQRKWLRHALAVLPELRAMAALLGQDYQVEIFDSIEHSYTNMLECDANKRRAADAPKPDEGIPF